MPAACLNELKHFVRHGGHGERLKWREVLRSMPEADRAPFPSHSAGKPPIRAAGVCTALASHRRLMQPL